MKTEMRTGILLVAALAIGKVMAQDGRIEIQITANDDTLRKSQLTGPGRGVDARKAIDERVRAEFKAALPYWDFVAIDDNSRVKCTFQLERYRSSTMVVFQCNQTRDFKGFKEVMELSPGVMSSSSATDWVKPVAQVAEAMAARLSQSRVLKSVPMAATVKSVSSSNVDFQVSLNSRPPAVSPPPNHDCFLLSPSVGTPFVAAGFSQFRGAVFDVSAKREPGCNSSPPAGAGSIVNAYLAGPSNIRRVTEAP